MGISAVELFLCELPVRAPFVAGHGETSSRTIVMVRITTPEGIGWGECSALPAATYTNESAADSFTALATDLAPLLVGKQITAKDVAGLLAAHRHRPMAISALEMAVLDAELRATGTSLADRLGVEQTTVPAGVSMGLDAIDITVHKAVALAEEGYRRIKVKIQPGHDIKLVSALRQALPTIELQVDANGGYSAADLGHLVELVGCGVDAFEQPLPPAEFAATAQLIERLSERAGPGAPVPVVADESVHSQDDAERLLLASAMTGLSIKPARVGGLLAARDLHDLCVANNLPATAGGMLETGLGRAALAALAGLPGFTLTGDLSPARRWLAADPWPDLELIDGRITIYRGPGIAPDPDLDLLSQLTTERLELRAEPGQQARGQ